MKKYRCSLCGYCYVPGETSSSLLPELSTPDSIEFKKLTDSWCCPQCGAPKTKFRPYGVKRRYL